MRSKSGAWGKIPRGGGRVKPPLCLEDGLKGGVKAVYVISDSSSYGK